jgi:hypothetical protein
MMSETVSDLNSIWRTSLIKAANSSPKLENTKRLELWPAVGSIILLMLALKDAKLPAPFILRGTSEQPRWNDLGEMCTLSPKQSGIDASLLKVLSNKDNRQQLFPALMAQPFTRAENVAIEDQKYRHFWIDRNLSNSITEALTMSERQWWEEQAFAMVLHAFPRGKSLDIMYV